MAVSTKIDIITRDVELSLLQEASPEGRSKALAQYARQSLAEAQEINRRSSGYVPNHQTVVDGRKGASEDSVRPDGTIVYEFALFAEMLMWIHEMLVKHSPVLKGHYAKAHVLTADGEAIDITGDIPDATEFAFVNVQPYARKIERGQSKQAPDGVYEAVAAMARARYGNLSRIRFSFRSPNFGMIRWWAGTTTLSGPDWKPGTRSRVRALRGAEQREWLTRQPAIVITR